MTQHSSPLRTAWGIPVDPADRDGVGPAASQRAVLPPELSRAFDRAREHLAVPDRSTLSQPLRVALSAPAIASAAEPLPFPLLHQYARFWRDGVRTDYEDDVRRLGITTGEAVLAAVAMGESTWIDRAADGLMLLCELSTWCWVAHEQAYDARGWVVPDPERPVVDLGAAQTLHVIAWADLALGEQLDARVPGLRARLRHEARTRVFDPYLARRDWHWLHGAAHNWTGWIHQHLVAAALLLLEGEGERRDRDTILSLSLAQLDRYLASFPADGGIDEGFSYFWNGASRLLEAIDLLITASGGVLDRAAVTRLPVVANLVRFPQRMDLGGGWFVNVADGPARLVGSQPWDVLHRWGHHLDATDVIAQARAYRGECAVPPIVPELGLGRVLTAISDQRWLEADSGPVAARRPLPLESWLPDVELLVAREREGDPSGLALAVKGGHNDEAHNHLDVGSYLVALDSSPLLIDLGQPTYTALTFTDRRYEIWTMTSSWHNLPEIRGHQQGIGAAYRAREVEARRATGDGALGEPRLATADDALRQDSSLALELSGTYPGQAGVRSYRRLAALERSSETGEGPAVAIRDSWHLDLGPAALADEQAAGAATDTARRDAPATSAPADVVLNHVIAGEILDFEPGLLRVRALSGAVAAVHWDRAFGAGSLERRAIDDPLLAASWGDAVHRLRILAPTGADGRGGFTLTIRRADADPR